MVEIPVPALRERKDDIEPLVSFFLSKQVPPRNRTDLPPSTMALLEAHDWLGNVRELRNMVTRLVLFPDLIAELGEVIRAEQKKSATNQKAAPQKPVAGANAPSEGHVEHLMDMTLLQARELLMEQFERAYARGRPSRWGYRGSSRTGRWIGMG